MDSTVRERFARIREHVTRVEQDAEGGRWDAAMVNLHTLNQETQFIRDWLRGQAEYHAEPAGPAAADVWEPPPEMPLENVTEPLSGTVDADVPVPR
jgi:hypothetical protein